MNFPQIAINTVPRSLRGGRGRSTKLCTKPGEDQHAWRTGCAARTGPRVRAAATSPQLPGGGRLCPTHQVQSLPVALRSRLATAPAGAAASMGAPAVRRPECREVPGSEDGRRRLCGRRGLGPALSPLARVPLAPPPAPSEANH